jgi:hypothetical protein
MEYYDFSFIKIIIFKALPVNKYQTLKELLET